SERPRGVGRNAKQWAQGQMRALRPAPANYGCLAVSARKTRSSTAMERVKIVAELAPGTATCEELLLSAGPAGLASVPDVSPGCKEMRVVCGVQGAAPRRVS